MSSSKRGTPVTAAEDSCTVQGSPSIRMVRGGSIAVVVFRLVR